MIRKSIELRFPDMPDHMIKLTGIGWDLIGDPSYYWDGTRRDNEGYLFQYTLSGEGRLRIGGTHYAVKKNQGFFVSFPSDHAYYYDSACEPWEFLWLKINGDEAQPYWDRFIMDFNSVAAMRPDSAPVRLLRDMYKGICTEELSDKYDISSRLYEWIFSVMRHADGSMDKDTLPGIVKGAKEFIDMHQHRKIGLREIAGSQGVSIHHLSRVFQKATGETPIVYLQKRRIEYAAQQLRNTELPIQTIAQGAGFDNASYFGKVFKSYIGVTPTEFRHGRSNVPAGELRLF